MGKIVKVTTATGFTCDVNRDILDDWEFAEAAAESTKGDMEALKLTVYTVNHLMSAEDVARLKDHVRTEDGRVSTTQMSKEVADIISKLNLKN